MSKRLILIRHGQTQWNLEKRYMGSTDIGLNCEGLAQADKLRARLKTTKVDRVYSSDSARAFDFAKIIFPRMAVEAMPELQEMDFGLIEGMTHDEIMKKYPSEYDRWLKDIHAANMPEGESMQIFRVRVLKAFNRIISHNHEKIIAIVTHAGPIRIIINEIVSSGDFWSTMPDSASVNIIELTGGEAKVLLLNDTSHL